MNYNKQHFFYRIAFWCQLSFVICGFHFKKLLNFESEPQHKIFAVLHYAVRYYFTYETFFYGLDVFLTEHCSRFFRGGGNCVVRKVWSMTSLSFKFGPALCIIINKYKYWSQINSFSQGTPKRPSLGKVKTLTFMKEFASRLFEL